MLPRRTLFATSRLWHTASTRGHSLSQFSPCLYPTRANFSTSISASDIEDLSKLKVADLKSHLKLVGLSALGKKAELKERLAAHLQAELERKPALLEKKQQKRRQPENKQSVADLKLHLKLVGLSALGKKTELTERLAAYLQAEAERKAALPEVKYVNPASQRKRQKKKQLKLEQAEIQSMTNERKQILADWLLQKKGEDSNSSLIEELRLSAEAKSWRAFSTRLSQAWKSDGGDPEVVSVLRRPEHIVSTWNKVSPQPEIIATPTKPTKSRASQLEKAPSSPSLGAPRRRQLQVVERGRSSMTLSQRIQPVKYNFRHIHRQWVKPFVLPKRALKKVRWLY